MAYFLCNPMSCRTAVWFELCPETSTSGFQRPAGPPDGAIACNQPIVYSGGSRRISHSPIGGFLTGFGPLANTASVQAGCRTSLADRERPQDVGSRPPGPFHILTVAASSRPLARDPPGWRAGWLRSCHRSTLHVGTVAGMTGGSPSGRVGCQRSTLRVGTVAGLTGGPPPGWDGCHTQPHSRHVATGTEELALADDCRWRVPEAGAATWRASSLGLAEVGTAQLASHRRA